MARATTSDNLNGALSAGYVNQRKNPRKGALFSGNWRGEKLAKMLELSQIMARAQHLAALSFPCASPLDSVVQMAQLMFVIAGLYLVAAR